MRDAAVRVRLVLNLLWLILAGLWPALAYVFAGNRLAQPPAGSIAL